MTQRKDKSPTKSLKELLTTHGFQLKKSLGQNFLIDTNVLNRILDAAEITQNDGVLEVGPGAGVVTRELAETAKQVVAVEKDTALEPVLKDSLSQFDNVQVIFSDILDVDMNELWKHFQTCQRVVVVANLPYYVTTPILFQILESEVPVDTIVVMVQKEVANRLTASPGTKDYGALTVAVQLRAKVDTVMQVHPGSFLPPPGVDSTVVRLRCYPSLPVRLQSVKTFRKVVRAAFATRRKTLYNALSNGLVLPKAQVALALDEANIDKSRRGETLTLDEFVHLSNFFHEML
ncbi:16S rRNA (adenine(1518)-N(6)/adenine(1519)-N(6))-dimethyltransferase RsmA [Alicyclobacillus sp. SO9]|uniref:16S rRNA (adenine(1518)-N(6)/adenine(1519)-N(6))- dimethyltransferase RsmA n=1 Tax=Alicyclobacillus sp. SO9 TaxID=2665646 RepID=UPI001E635ADB|nr:16S rRNA (adenine(1518)-N(6)/adenine(1519)-N(6))-dimethyltransferase RsmA [Alicyclobacillus sp. SO9]